MQSTKEEKQCDKEHDHISTLLQKYVYKFRG